MVTYAETFSPPISEVGREPVEFSDRSTRLPCEAACGSDGGLEAGKSRAACGVTAYGADSVVACVRAGAVAPVTLFTDVEEGVVPFACGFFALDLGSPPRHEQNTMASATKIPTNIQSVLFIKTGLQITNALLSVKAIFATLSS